MDILTLAASPVLGSVLKIVAGAVAGWREGKREEKKLENERWLERSAEGRKVLIAQSTLGSKDPEHIRYALSTRRHIALLLTYTLCTISILWSLYPDVQIITQNRGAGTKTYFWNFYTSTFADPFTFIISTGDVVFGVLHLVGIIIGIYATPDRTGK